MKENSSESLKEIIKDIIVRSVESFVTTNEGTVFRCVNTLSPRDLSKEMISFRSMYLSDYSLTEDDIRDTIPYSAMLHVLGIKDRLLKKSELFSDTENFNKCLIDFYKQCGVVEIRT